MDPLKVSTVNQFFDSKFYTQKINRSDTVSFDSDGKLIKQTRTMQGDKKPYYCNLAVHRLEKNLKFLSNAAAQAAGGKVTSHQQHDQLQQRVVTEVSQGDLLTIDSLMEKSFSIREADMAELNDLQADLTSAIFNKEDIPSISAKARKFVETACKYFENQPSDTPYPQRLAAFLKLVQAAVLQDCGDPAGLSQESIAAISSQNFALEKVSGGYEDLQQVLTATAESGNLFSPTHSQEEGLTLGSLRSSQMLQVPQVRAHAENLSPTSALDRKKVITAEGQRLLLDINAAKEWGYNPSDEKEKQDFLNSMDHLFYQCQTHMTKLSRGYSGNPPAKVVDECDELSAKLVQLRNHWGYKILPNTICNAFVRERIPVQYQDQRCLADYNQYFEAIPVDPALSSASGGLMKLFRTSVVSSKGKVVCRYFLERSHISPFYTLSKVTSGQRSFITRFGDEKPSYWKVREAVIADIREHRTALSTPSVTKTSPTTTPHSPSKPTVTTWQELQQEFLVENMAEYRQLCELVGDDYMQWPGVKARLSAFRQLQRLNPGIKNEAFRQLMEQIPESSMGNWLYDMNSSRTSPRPFFNIMSPAKYAIKVCLPPDTRPEIIGAIDLLSLNGLAAPYLLKQVSFLDQLLKMSLSSRGGHTLKAEDIAVLLNQNIVTPLYIDQTEKTLTSPFDAQTSVAELSENIRHREWLEDQAWQVYIKDNIPQLMQNKFGMQIKQVRADGDCFYSAIGQLVGEPMREVRRKCHTTAIHVLEMAKGQYKGDPTTTYANDLRAACQIFSKQQLDDLQDKVNRNIFLTPSFERSDDKSLAWGGRDDMPLVALTYGRPVVPVCKLDGYTDQLSYKWDGSVQISNSAIKEQNFKPLVLLNATGDHWDPMVSIEDI